MPRGAPPCSRIRATATSRPTARWSRSKASTISWWSRPQDAVLVSRQKDANGLKRLVAKLKTVAPQVTEDHIKVHRPWGSYQSVDNGDRHQVKRIIVKPGGRLSLQKHHHRSEHWIVVRGTAQRDRQRTRQDRARERVRSIFRSARCTGWKIPARSNWS